MRSLSWFVILQSFISAGLVTLLWFLHARLGRRPFFKWWAWAWTVFALYLALGAQALPPSSSWTTSTVIALFIATLCGYLQPVLLIFGAISLQTPEWPDGRWRRAGLALGLAAGTIGFVASLAFDNPIDSLCVRLAPRAWALAAAAAFTAVVFLRRSRAMRSLAGQATAGACLFYAVIQSAYGLAASGRLVAGETAPLAALFASDPGLRAQLFLFDVITAYAICLGIVLLLVEEYQRSMQALEESLRLRREAVEENAVLQAEVRERRRMEEALRISEARFAAAFRTNPCSVAISRIDDGRILEINDSCAEQTGYSRSEVIGRRVLDLGLWVDPAARDAIMAELTAGGKVRNREVRWRSKSGAELTILYSADTITMDDQPCVLSVAMDITAHKRVETHHRAILRALPDWIFLTSAQGVYLDCHVKDRTNLLAEPETFIGQTLHDTLPPALADDLTRLSDRVAQTDETGTLEYSVPIRGELRYYEVRSVRCDTDKILSIVRDVTEARRTELQVHELRRELAQIGRVTTLSALAGSLAHEICQPLTGMRTTAQAGLRFLAQPHPDLIQLREALVDIVADSDRAATVIQRVRSMLGREPPDRSPVDLNAAVEEVLKLLRVDLHEKGITLALDLQPGLPPVLGDRVQLQQVALNLLINACEAVEAQPAAAKRVLLRTAMLDGWVALAVTDEGPGLSGDQITRVFEPFYTTKSTGMGLGLWICEMIIESHDGRITVEPNSGPGATFRLRLPPMTARQTEAEAVEVSGGVRPA